MTHIFLKDIIDKAIRRGAVSSTRFYNIIIPDLSNNNINLIFSSELYNTLEVSNSSYKFEAGGIKYIIRTKFPDTFTEDKIKHSFHKTSIRGFISNKPNEECYIDLYLNNKSDGFEDS